ncbi:MAG: hydrogenase expression/formation protein HypE [Candidatus Omnitrophota bacterium]
MAIKNSKIMLSHGSGGQMMHDLIKNLILPKFGNPLLNKLTDSAVIEFKDISDKGLSEGLAFTSDSFVVNPLFFRGGDIGKLAVFGTINDLVVSGALPLYLSLSLIIEEGLDYFLLERVLDSISSASLDSRVKVVTGDIKVVEEGACDKLFINTAGIGRVIRDFKIKDIKTGDQVIITGRIAEHGLSILSQRKGMDFGLDVKSDCISLSRLLIPLLKKYEAAPSGRSRNRVRRCGIKFMRDPTRGGLATTLNEIARASNLGIVIEESKVPIANRIRAACELLGMDPLYIANEGKAVLVVSPDSAGGILKDLNQHRQGRHARIIGKITPIPKGKVILNTAVGTSRILDMLSSEPLPRIC